MASTSLRNNANSEASRDVPPPLTTFYQMLEIILNHIINNQSLETTSLHNSLQYLQIQDTNQYI